MRKTIVLIFIISTILSFLMSFETCPGKNVISKMTTNMDSFKAVSPLDHKTIRSSGAQLSKDGTKLTVSLSNMESVPVNKLVNDFVLPITKKEQFILDIEFRNAKKEIVAGTYSGSSGYGKPFWVFAEVKLHKGEKGVIVSMGIREGKALITKITESFVCGKFELKGKKGSTQNSSLAGEFNVKLERSAW